MPKKLTKNEFIEKSILKHGNKYDYSEVVYVNRNSKINIICKMHGNFIQTASDHYQNGCGCPKCGPTSTLGNERFIEKSILKHGYKYDYSKVNYKKNDIKIEILCKIHGSFFQKPGPHLRGQGCPKCINNTKSTTEEFVIKANIKHNNLYDYSLVDYKTKKDKIKIICLDHGIFEQKAYVHLSGHGCPICKNSKLERYMRHKLKLINLDFEQNKRFNDCRNVLPLPFDFYIKDRNILIECDGIQHKKPVDYFGGIERLEYQIKNDSIKNEYCKKNKIELIRVNNFSDIDGFLLNI